jgi:hypothetical protein
MMAKISARGDKERARWRDEEGAELVLTWGGRLLRKHVAGGSLTLHSAQHTMESAATHAHALGMERV